MPKGIPTPPLVSGISNKGTIFQDYVFASGIHKPEHSNILSWKFPQYYMTALLERIGSYEPTSQDVFSWNEMDRTRVSAEIVSATGLPGATPVVTVNIPSDTGYFIVNDVIRFTTGKQARITAIADNAGDTALTVAALGGATLTAGDVVATESVGHVYNAFPEGSMGPKGRLYLPEEKYNNLTILRRGIEITGSEFTNRTYIGDGKAWYFTIEDIEMKEFALDREILMLTGIQNDTGTKVTKGLLDFAAYGVNNTFASAAGVSEQNLQDHIKSMMIQGVGNEITVLCGADFMADVQRTLKDYALAGAKDYGSFPSNKMAGLDFESYRFMGKTIHFVYYALFDDYAVFPQIAASATKANMSNYSLWIDMTSDAVGKRNVVMKYKELNGVSRKFIHTHEAGMMNPSGASGGLVSNSFDGFKVNYLAEVGLEVRVPQRTLGVLRANS